MNTSEPKLIEREGRYYIQVYPTTRYAPNEWAELALDGSESFFDVLENGEFHRYVQESIDLKGIHDMMKSFRTQGSILKYIKEHHLTKWKRPQMEILPRV